MGLIIIAFWNFPEIKEEIQYWRNEFGCKFRLTFEDLLPHVNASVGKLVSLCLHDDASRIISWGYIALH